MQLKKGRKKHVVDIIRNIDVLVDHELKLDLRFFDNLQK